MRSRLLQTSQVTRENSSEDSHHQYPTRTVPAHRLRNSFAEIRLHRLQAWPLYRIRTNPDYYLRFGSPGLLHPTNTELYDESELLDTQCLPILARIPLAPLQSCLRDHWSVRRFQR